MGFEEPNRRNRKLLLAGICAAYLIITSAYSLLVPAWETNDEMDHVANIEYMLEHRKLVPLRLEAWHETHQPPLYYALAALWQAAFGIEPFTPAEPRKLGLPMVGPVPQLAYVHDYTPEQRGAAAVVHRLRFLSVLIGLFTVLLTYTAGRLATGSTHVGLAAAATVAVLPKFNVISAAVTNDGLVVLLCSATLVFALATPSRPWTKRLIFAACLGACAGLALLTKLNSIPVSCALLAYTLLMPRLDLRQRLQCFATAVGAVLLTAGWWLWMNYTQQGDPLGQAGVHEWLNQRLPGLISIVPWYDRERFLNFVPSQLMQSIWYNGGWNQFVAPFAFNLCLTLLAGISLFATTKALVDGGRIVRRHDRAVLLLFGCAAAAIAAVIIIAKSTTQAEGRVAYVGLTALVILIVTGLSEAVGGSKRRQKFSLFAWPAILLIFNVYVCLRFVIPYRVF